MAGKSFLDTNILIHALAEGDPRTSQAECVLASGGVISVQVLNEFVSVARGKLAMSWREVEQALEAFRSLCETLPLTLEVHQNSLELAQRYRYEIYDACVIASALDAGCSTLYSEDLRDGQVIANQLTIRNPFAANAGVES